MRYIILILILLSCGEYQDDTITTDVTEKNLFSRWISISDPDTSIDLTDMEFRRMGYIYWPKESGEVCRSESTIIGTQYTGTIQIDESLKYMGLGTMVCSSIVGNYTYSKTTNRLTVCNIDNCIIYK